MSAAILDRPPAKRNGSGPSSIRERPIGVLWPETASPTGRLSQIEWALQINMAALVVLASIMLGSGQRDYTHAAIVSVLAVISLIVTDRLRWLRVPRVIGNVIALVATVYVLYNFVIERQNSFGNQLPQLYTIANLLIYLEIVLLFNRKRTRIYWQLFVLSLLQVVVAAAIQSDLTFAFGIGVYLCLSLSAGILFFLYREIHRVLDIAEADVPGQVPLGRTAVFPGTGHEVASRWSLSRLVRQTFWGLMISLLAGGLFFFGVPRPKWQRYMGLAPYTRTEIGFTDQIDLDALRDLQDNPQKVMRVSYRNSVTNRLQPIVGMPYLRGAVLTELNLDSDQNVHWSASHPYLSRASVPVPLAPSGIDLVIQDIQLEPTEGNVLFSMFPAYRIPGVTSENIRLSTETLQLRHLDGEKAPPNKSLRYTLAVGQARGGIQTAYIPETRDPRGAPWGCTGGFERGIRIGGLSQRFGGMGWAAYPHLVETAQQVLKDSDRLDAPRYQQIESLLLHFLQTGKYTYSLELSKIARDRDLNTMEDFVANHRTGQCEYFASALCLMLRSRQIPARMIVGYRPEEFNNVGQFYQVRQRDAHAWVEAYLTKEDAAEAFPDETFTAGIWVRYDPTPIQGSLSGLSQQMPWYEDLTQSLDYLQFLWSDYVVTLNRDRQREMIDAAIAEEGDDLTAISGLNTFVMETYRFFQRYGVALLAAVGGFFVLFGVSRIVVRRIRARWPRLESRLGFSARSGYRKTISVSPLVNRWHDLLRKRSLMAGDSAARSDLTEREVFQFAVVRAVDPTWRDRLRQFGERLVTAYHEERFGNRPLDSQTLRELETDLRGLEGAVT